MFQRLVITFTNGDKEAYFLIKGDTINLNRKDTTVFVWDQYNDHTELAVNHIRSIRSHTGDYYKVTDNKVGFYIP